MSLLTFEPVDSWFFRGSSTFDRGETNQSVVDPVFPPHPYTVAGAIRAGLAREQGWSPSRDNVSWNDQIKRVLGDGYDDLGELQFQGPFLQRNGELLFPVPFHLLAQPVENNASKKTEGDAWEKFVSLAPGTAVDCDLGSGVRLPEPLENVRRLVSLKSYYVTASDLEKILNNEGIETIETVADDKLYTAEKRAGLTIDTETGKADEGKLYFPVHLRLRKGVNLAESLEGIPDDWKLPDVVPLGGESRLARLGNRPGGLKLPPAPALPNEAGKVKFTITFLVPFNPGEKWPEPGGAIPGFPSVKIISGCIEKSARISGWNGIEREPLPLRSYVPAGSTLFCEIDAGESNKISEIHAKNIGEQTEYGFGLAVVGRWPE